MTHSADSHADALLRAILAASAERIAVEADWSDNGVGGCKARNAQGVKCSIQLKHTGLPHRFCLKQPHEGYCVAECYAPAGQQGGRAEGAACPIATAAAYLARLAPAVPPERSTAPYAIGSDTWAGLSKLIEEAGEVQQVAGKILGAGGSATHWDGGRSLRDRLTEEIADLQAACRFVAVQNGLDGAAIAERTERKFDVFKQWHTAGSLPPAAAQSDAPLDTAERVELEELRHYMQSLMRGGQPLPDDRQRRLRLMTLERRARETP